MLVNEQDEAVATAGASRVLRERDDLSAVKAFDKDLPAHPCTFGVANGKRGNGRIGCARCSEGIAEVVDIVKLPFFVGAKGSGAAKDSSALSRGEYNSCAGSSSLPGNILSKSSANHWYDSRN